MSLPQMELDTNGFAGLHKFFVKYPNVISCLTTRNNANWLTVTKGN